MSRENLVGAYLPGSPADLTVETVEVTDSVSIPTGYHRPSSVPYTKTANGERVLNRSAVLNAPAWVCCDVCAAMVAWSDTGKHTAWHAAGRVGP